MMGKSAKTTWYRDSLRTLFSLFDKIVFWLLVLVYQIFFEVATATILKGATVRAFFGRIQLIFGILIMFRLIMSLISGIINPDSLTDKDKGFTKIISRVIIALIMIVLIMPVNIPNATSDYQKKINTHGILFGTLYEFQARVLNNNTIGKLILGSNYGGTSAKNSDGGSEEESMKASANLMTSVIVKTFVRINLKNGKDAQDDELDIANWRCNPEDFDGDAESAMTNYTKMYSDPQYILDNINSSCGKGPGGGSPKYVFNYVILLGTVVGGLLVFILLGFTIDVAVRAVKLAVLRLIAPIPIISYIDPKSEKDGAFNNWVQTLMSTYLDLFLRLMIIYFAIFLVEEIAINGIVMDFGSNALVNGLAKVFVFIGIFFFAKQAPDFIKQMFGIKGESKGFFSGMGNLLKAGGLALGAGAVAGGIAGSTLSNAFRYGRQHNTESLEDNPTGNKAKRILGNVGAGLLGGITGGVSSGIAGAKAKDHKFSAAINKGKSRAALRETGSTAFGRGRQGTLDAFGLDPTAKADARIARNKDFVDTFKYIDQRLDNDMTTMDYSSHSLLGLNALGEDLSNTSIKDQTKVLENMKLGGYSANEIAEQDDIVSKMKATRYATRATDSSDELASDIANLNDISSTNGYGTNVGDYSSIKKTRFEAESDSHMVSNTKEYKAAKNQQNINKNNK